MRGQALETWFRPYGAVLVRLATVFAFFFVIIAAPAQAQDNGTGVDGSDLALGYFDPSLSFAQFAETEPSFELTPELLSNYIARRQGVTLRSAALDQANALATQPSFPPLPRERMLTEQLLQNYVSNNYLTTDQRLELAAEERRCLAQAIYHEARGEPEAGQWAVAEVILNRMASPRFPNTICGVVFQNANLTNRCQFSFACDGQSDHGGIGNIIVRESWVKANLIAKMAYDMNQKGTLEPQLPGNVLFYHNRSVSPSWAASMTHQGQIGGHIFYASNR